MATPMDYLRMQNLFGNTNMSQPPQQQGFTTPDMFPGAQPNPMGNISLAPPTAAPSGASQMQPQSNPDADIVSKIMGSYSPETTASDRFNTLVDSYPNREAPENKPSMLRRIGGALAAIGPQFEHGHFKYNPQAQAAGEAFVDKPYTDKLTDWKNQLQPAYEAANLERYGNVNNRTLMYQTMQSHLKEQAQIERQNNDEAKANVAERRASMYEYAKLNPDVKFDFTGPFVKILDPKPGGKVTVTTVPTGHMTEMDKLTLGHSNRMAEIGERDASKGVPYDIPDPDDPTGKRKIPVMVSPTGQATRITLGTGAGRKPVNAPILKPGTETPANPANLQGIQDSAKETMNAINNMIDESDPKNPQLRDNVKGAIGASRMLGLQHVPGSETYTADVAIKNLKSNLLLNLIQKMKNETKNGTTGFGRITNADLAVMSQAASRLDSGTDRETFRKELLRVKEKVQMILDNPNGNNGGQTDVTPGTTAADMLKEFSDPNYKPPKKKD